MFYVGSFVGLLGFCLKSFLGVGVLHLMGCCKLVRPLFLIVGFPFVAVIYNRNI